ncbi:MAG: DsrE family protein [Candidatus Bathyarchaeota archaeon]|jgi:peroxiredoxin family protein|nr:DsrE family protein [Candidatus Bathyarchaeota archaeon]
MRLLLVVSTPGKLRDVEGLSSAAARAGHDVTVFFNEESIQLLKSPSPVEYLYADLLACRASAIEYQITKDNMAVNARMSSLGELVEQLEQNDRVVFLG